MITSAPPIEAPPPLPTLQAHSDGKMALKITLVVFGFFYNLGQAAQLRTQFPVLQEPVLSGWFVLIVLIAALGVVPTIIAIVRKVRLRWLVGLNILSMIVMTIILVTAGLSLGLYQYWKFATFVMALELFFRILISTRMKRYYL